MVDPEKDDVVIRRRAGDTGMGFVLGTLPAPEQFTLRTRNEAIVHALTFAERHRVGAWLVNGADKFVLLGTFRTETVKSVS
jgi:hypothetical protein